jgi:hypothetical protein
MRKSVLLWILSVTAAAAVSAGVAAQAVQSQRSDQVRILSGSDIGFRVEGQKRELRRNGLGRSEPTDVVTGHYVVRINGAWIEVSEGGGVRPLTI